MTAEILRQAIETNIASTIDDLKKQGMWIAAADMDGQEIISGTWTSPS